MFQILPTPHPALYLKTARFSLGFDLMDLWPGRWSLGLHRSAPRGGITPPHPNPRRRRVFHPPAPTANQVAVNHDQPPCVNRQLLLVALSILQQGAQSTATVQLTNLTHYAGNR